MTTIEALAHAEVAATSTKNKADTAQRKAWWALTIALGLIEGYNNVGPEIDKVVAITGQSTQWVKKRRALGARIVKSSPEGTFDDLPPRLLMEIPAKQFSAETVELARQAEAEGMSLREFSAMLTGKNWADTPEGLSAETLTKAIDSASPTVIAAVIESVSDDAFEEINEAIVAVTTPAEAVMDEAGVKPAHVPSPKKVKVAQKTADKVTSAKWAAKTKAMIAKAEAEGDTETVELLTETPVVNTGGANDGAAEGDEAIALALLDSYTPGELYNAAELIEKVKVDLTKRGKSLKGNVIGYTLTWLDAIDENSKAIRTIAEFAKEVQNLP